MLTWKDQGFTQEEQVPEIGEITPRVAVELREQVGQVKRIVTGFQSSSRSCCE